MATIFHLALASDWAEARANGTYTISTLGRTLAEEGFIHASRADQWTAVRERFYADVTAPLVLLQIDTDQVGVPIVEEPAVPGGTETFPHIYGPLPVKAVVKAIPLDPPAPASAPASAPPPASATSPASFTQTYFREMFGNAALLTLVVIAGLAGAGIGSLINDDAVGIGGLAGLVAGVALLVWIYRRRR